MSEIKQSTFDITTYGGRKEQLWRHDGCVGFHWHKKKILWYHWHNNGVSYILASRWLKSIRPGNISGACASILSPFTTSKCIWCAHRLSWPTKWHNFWTAMLIFLTTREGLKKLLVADMSLTPWPPPPLDVFLPTPTNKYMGVFLIIFRVPADLFIIPAFAILHYLPSVIL